MPKASQDAFEKISQMYYELTASEKKTADYVLGHRNETQYMSIAELAEESGVAEATVSRFCRRLGYGGYNVFKLAIANATAAQRSGPAALSGQVEEGDSLEDLCRKLYAADQAAMAQTLALIRPERISQAVDLIENAQRVVCMGQGGSMLMASEAAHLFSTVGARFYAISDSHIQSITAANMGEKDVILFFSYSGATRDMMETLSVAREQGAQVILVTRFPKSPGVTQASVVLPVGSNESPLQLGSIPARIAQMFLLDVLFAEYCRRHPDSCMEGRERVAAALAKKHL